MEWNEQLLICELPLHSASLVAGYGLYICGPTHSINCSLSFHPYSLSFFNGRQTSWLSAQHKKRWTGKPAGMKAIHKLLKWNGGAAEGRQPITHSFNNQSPALSCLHSWVGPAHCCFMNQRKFVCFLFIAEHCGVPPPLTHNSRKTNFLFIIHNQQRQRAANNFTFLFKKEEKFVVLLFAAAASAGNTSTSFHKVEAFPWAALPSTNSFHSQFPFSKRIVKWNWVLLLGCRCSINSFRNSFIHKSKVFNLFIHLSAPYHWLNQLLL